MTNAQTILYGKYITHALELPTPEGAYKTLKKTLDISKANKQTTNLQFN